MINVAALKTSAILQKPCQGLSRRSATKMTSMAATAMAPVQSSEAPLAGALSGPTPCMSHPKENQFDAKPTLLQLMKSRRAAPEPKAGTKPKPKPKTKQSKIDFDR